MQSYGNPSPTATAELEAACERVRGNPAHLPLAAYRVGPRVYLNQLDFSTAWDGLFLAAVSGGMPHMLAQKTLGRAFALARVSVLQRPAEA